MPPELQFLENATWHCEPPDWSLDDTGLSVRTGDSTDFWQGTYYGFHRDDGHFYGASINGNFTAAVDFEGAYQTLYDQAGLMMRADRDNWIKAGIEFSDDIANFSVVVTRDGRSDWSVVGAPWAKGAQTIRLTRLDGAVLIHHRGMDGGWNLMRLAGFPPADSLRIGPMACSPQREGFTAKFTAFRVSPPVSSPLHDN